MNRQSVAEISTFHKGPSRFGACCNCLLVEWRDAYTIYALKTHEDRSDLRSAGIQSVQLPPLPHDTTTLPDAIVMRDIVVLSDQNYKIVDEEFSDASVAGLSFDKSGARAFVLLSTGVVLCYSDADDSFAYTSRVSCCVDDEEFDNEWFELSFIAGTGSIVAISRSGSIVAIEGAGPGDLAAEQIGCIEGGIAAAKWCPDQSCLTIVTNNDTIICMSSTWDVLQEIPVTTRAKDSPAGVSWRGDGEGLAILTLDSEDQTARVRVYNKQLELVATGRNVADGPVSVMKDLGGAVAFATNGSYVAVCQEQRTGSGANKLLVALVERNGLRHGDFEVHTPPVPQGWERWEVSSLHWDLPTSLLAVGLRAMRGADAAISQPRDTGRPGILQLYCRGNYHWYLKQQWRGPDLSFLGFDEEQVNRLYLTQSAPTERGGAGNRSGGAVLRVVDLTWDVCSSGTADSSVAVTDGNKLLFTPLGINNIPPPMCKHTLVLDPAAGGAAPSALMAVQGGRCPRSTCFWRVPPSAASDMQIAWGFAALCTDSCGTHVVVVYGDKAGNIGPQQWLDVTALCAADHAQSGEERTQHIAYRGVTVAQAGGSVRVVLLGSAAAILTTDTASAGRPAGDLLVVVDVEATSGTTGEVTLADREARVRVVTLPDGCATRIFPAPHEPDCVGVGIVRAGSDGSEFEVYRVRVDGNCEGSECVSLIHTLPEQCSHLAFVAAPRTVSDAGGEDSTAVMALSLRNRLYCGESLLSSAVSSFVYNEPFGMLMFATLGTRPHLHFCSIQRYVGTAHLVIVERS
jgi:hypothetical protein